MAGKAKTKTKPKTKRKVISKEPRRGRSRPVWALLFFMLALMVCVALLDFETSQSRQRTTEPETNLVGGLGAEGSFWAFRWIGVAAWLGPLYLFWTGLRFLTRQEPRKRLFVVLASIVSLVCASGLATMLGHGKQVQDSVFRRQLIDDGAGFGGWLGQFLSTEFLQPYIGSFGAFLLFLMAFLIGSVVVFTDNFGRAIESLQKSYRSFRANRAEARKARKQRKAEGAEAKRLAREEAARAKAEAKAEKAAAKAARKDARKQLDPDPELDDAPAEDGSKPSSLPAAPTQTRKKAFSKKPKLDPDGTVKIISGEENGKGNGRHSRASRGLRLPATRFAD